MAQKMGDGSKIGRIRTDHGSSTATVESDSQIVSNAVGLVGNECFEQNVCKYHSILISNENRI